MGWGLGGPGLALHAAARVAERYPDGVVVVALAAAGTADPVVAVAAALGIPDAADASLATRIVEVLAVRRQLIVLDNCEHLLEPVAEFVEAITTGSERVDVLAASREPCAPTASGWTPDGEHRLVMFEIVSEYGLECLTASGAEPQLRQRHAEHYLSLAEQAALLQPRGDSALAQPARGPERCRATHPAVHPTSPLRHTGEDLRRPRRCSSWVPEPGRGT